MTETTETPQLTKAQLEKRNEGYKGWLFLALIGLCCCGALALFVDATIGGVGFLIVMGRMIAGGGSA